MSTIIETSKTTDSFKLLIRLKWTLLLRAYSRQKMKLFGLILLALIFVPMSVGFAVFCYLFGRDNPFAVPIMAKAILGVAYLVWLITPLLGFPMNESYDPSRLFVYPVPLRTIFAANVVGGLFELSTLLALPSLIAIGMLMSSGPVSALIALISLTLFLLHTIATGQLIMLSLIGFLRSRRFRDITIVLFPLIAMSFYIARQSALAHMASYDVFDILRWPIWSWMTFIPPGWATNSAINASYGMYGGSILYLALLSVATALPVFAGAEVLKRMYRGDQGPIAPVRRSMPSVAKPHSKSIEQPVAGTFATRYPDIAALIRKELIYFVREPQYKALLMNMAYSFVPLLFIYMNSGHQLRMFDDPNEALAQIILLTRSFLLPTLLLLSTLALTFNIFGGDAVAIPVLLSFPTPRIRMIVAKNIVHAGLVVGIGLLGIVASALLLHETRLIFYALLWIVMATPVILGAGNLVSVRFPHKMVVYGQRWNKGGQVTLGSGPSGCLYAILRLLAYFGAMATLAPAGCAIIVPLLLDRSDLILITGPIGMVYSVLIYWGATNWAASIMANREYEFIHDLMPED